MAKHDKTQEAGGIAMVGSIILGVGIGWAIRPEYIVQGLIIGFGLGLILMAIMRRA
ncbi:MAG TPA: hypothetical protein VLA92_04465 [Candidatus Saccharimonadales bacterium]|nr:hypothetical protein [Candidatus Saccharimonadales bacterium]